MRLLEGRIVVDDVDALVATLNDVSAETGATVQAFDAGYVVDETHLRRALELADRAIERGTNVAHDRSVEVLLYAAGRRQIDQALTMGLDEGENEAVVLVDGGDEAAAAARVGALLDGTATLGRYDPDVVADFFDVTEAELAAVEGGLADVVHERVALLEVEK